MEPVLASSLAPLLLLPTESTPCHLQLDVQLDGRIVDCAQKSPADNPVCIASAAAATAAGQEPSSRLAVSPVLAGVVSVTRNAPYSILPFSFALTAAVVDCAATSRL